MFLGMQNDLIAMVADTKEELEKLNYIVFTEIVETEDTYILENGNFVKQDEQYFSEKLEKIKTEKLSENTQKAKQAIEEGYVIFKDAQFETNAQTVGDLTATMLMLQAQQDNCHSEALAEESQTETEGDISGNALNMTNSHSEDENVILSVSEESPCHEALAEESEDISTQNITGPSVVPLPQDDNKTVILSDSEESPCHSEPIDCSGVKNLIEKDSSGQAPQNDINSLPQDNNNLLPQDDGILNYTWLSKDDNVVELTLQDFITLGNLIAEYKNTIWNVKYTAFKTAIENAQTIDELESIDIDYFKEAGGE